ncbi:hypothetical protein GF339_07400 [candidate division KSB3 bacterium]|uniref:Uncharacterized protein n=1 Tax=candidate division KSB3 bacterium TaxID=2044937 RepID=A0A9D5JUH6_9BACT|nr:hypothetical protein [candidate division KSB3 bacterium]MBD3324395.1 hypothetical protein [candidate division KSB3 bacterium]
MRNFYTVVLERMNTFTEDFATEPYETGWASEAMFFIRVHEMAGSKVELDSVVQVSADGIEWIDEGTSFLMMRQPGNSFVKVTHFGGWLRLRNELSGSNPKVKVTIHLVLKE